jgi:TolA-binding protein
MQCGKLLKEDLQIPVALPIETASSSADVTVEVSGKTVTANAGRDDVDTHTIIANAETNGQTSTATSSTEAVPLPEPAPIEALVIADGQQKQEDPSPIADGSTLLVQPRSIGEESRSPVVEIPTQMAANPVMEQVQTPISTQTIPESMLQQEPTPVVEIPTQMAANPVMEQVQTPIDIQTVPESMLQQEPTVKRQQLGSTPSQPVVAAEQFGDAAQLGNPAMPGGVLTPHPYQVPPGYPGSGEYPNYSGSPSAPYYPGYPAPGGMHQSAPTYPSYPGYPPAQPPGMYPPGMSGAEYPPMPAWAANQASGPATPGYPMMPPPTTLPPVGPRKIARIAQPLPIWVLIVSTIATLGILVVLQLIGSDWADGAMRAATAAITIAVLLLLFAGVRIFFGMLNEANKKRIAQTIGSALAVVLLFVYSGLALIGQTPLHMAQAQALEGQRQWQQAINEYQLGGETAPVSTNLARVYDKWGEALNKSGQYTDAISKFNVVIDGYTTTDEITRAQKGEAIAYYNLAQSQLKAQQYNDAITNFKTLLSHFANYPEAQKAHAPLATALLGKGKQDRASVCKSAVPTYQELATTYSDTPEGKAAANELSLPQAVTGHFTSSLPTDGVLTAVLTTTPINGNMSGNEFGPIIRNSPITAPINGNGTFKFEPQKQGTYDLAWIYTTPDTIHSIFYYKVYDPAKSASYVATVGPLCTFDFGDITSTFNPQ